MPVDPQIPLSYQSPQAPNPMAQYGQVMALKTAMQGQQVQQAQLQGMEQENQMRAVQMQDQQTMRQAFMDSNGDPDKLMQLARERGVSPQTLMQVQGNILDMKTKAATLTKDTLENAQTKNDQVQSAFAPIVNEKDPVKQAAQWTQTQHELLTQGTITPQEASQMVYPGSADGVKLFVAHLNLGKYTLAQQQEATAKDRSTTADVAQQKLQWLQGLKKNPETGDQQIESILPTQTDPQANAAYKAALRVAGTPEAATAILQAATSHAGQLATDTNPNVMAAKAKQAGMTAQAEIPAKVQTAVSTENATSGIKVKQAVDTAKALYGGNTAEVSEVPPKDLPAVSQAKQKAGSDLVTATGAANEMASMVDAMRAGNKVAYSYAPVTGVLTINAANGTKRVNMAEIEKYAAAGSAVDNVTAFLKKNAKGEGIPEGIVNDMDALHQNLYKVAQDNYRNAITNTNNTYRSSIDPDSLLQQMKTTRGAATPQSGSPTYTKGQTVKLKSGKSVVVTAVHPDGSFDAK